jgi:hypothetical protein
MTDADADADADFYWRCARCDCKYLASQAVVKVAPYLACPNCGEAEDVFRADDGEWPSEALVWTWEGTKRSPRIKKKKERA